MSIKSLQGRHVILFICFFCTDNNYTVSQKFQIIRTDFDVIWRKYSKYSKIEFACFSFSVSLLFYQFIIFQTGHQKCREF